MTTEQKRLMIDVSGIQDQIKKAHFLNVHFRAFQLAHDAWREHIRMNALTGARRVNSPAGAVLDNERSDVRAEGASHE